VSPKRNPLLAALVFLLPIVAFVAAPASAATIHHKLKHHVVAHHTALHHVSAHHVVAKKLHHTAS
jgi:hypothetical protein